MRAPYALTGFKWGAIGKPSPEKMSADEKEQTQKEQAPENKPVPVSASEPISGERLPADFPLEDLIAHVQSRVESRIEMRAEYSHSGPLPAP